MNNAFRNIRVKVFCAVHNTEVDVWFIDGPGGIRFFNGCDAYSANYPECGTICKERASSMLIQSDLRF